MWGLQHPMACHVLCRHPLMVWCWRRECWPVVTGVRWSDVDIHMFKSSDSGGDDVWQ